ncbi:DUF1592 domain-containing protein [Rhodopirellula sp. P2]|uniref:DUF1592 domain-containing protein n=1 Tax=Rhodopirellula sp. P2 TaxID=2127060 RepID=UPI002367B23A|nr:DUF1592 domain-containing protein [Rhodopirellula sp. P2]WDQ15966.1 DUF1592 domain-containing protein [Rhodopirellula sp. P2]
MKTNSFPLSPPRLLFAFALLLAVSGWFVGLPRVSAEQPSEPITEFLELNCTTCHDSSTQEGNLDLESLTLELADPDNFHLWERVFDRIGAGEMPPDEDLDPSESKPFLSELHGILEHSDQQRIATEGRVPARRLTRTQYERNVCDLLAIDVPLRDFLPAESLADGFDTVSSSQQVSDHSLAAYLDAADFALQTAFDRLLAADPSGHQSLNHIHLDWTKLRRNEKRTNREPEGRPEHQDIVSWSSSQNFYGRMPATSVPATGRYKIRVKAHSVNTPEMGRVWCSVNSGVCSGKASTMYWIGSIEATDEPQVHEFEAWIREGHMLQIVPNDHGIRRLAAKAVESKPGVVEEMGVAGIAIQWIDLERLEGDREEIRHALIGDMELQPLAATNKHSTQRFKIVSANPKRDLKERIQAFAEKAFRQKLTAQELQPYFEFSEAKRQVNHSMQDALRAGYRAILCSSRFLYFDEPPGQLSDAAVANRLSHFLWGRAPDDELRQLAESGQLRNPDVLRAQTERLLNDTRSQVAINEFTDQWLQLHELESTTPDGQLYPEYDLVLHHSLPDETQAFVGELIRRDLPVTHVIDSDFTFLNQRLARHYKIDWPGGTGLKRVPLASDSRRGGVISQASVLKVTANGTTTSPIIRGVWMLERIMGEHVPPPPANVAAVEPDIRGATSIRDQLDKHRNLEMCASCHVKIDPPGFALESYDVIGGWRDRYRAAAPNKGKRWVPGLPIDPSHEFTTGEAFKDVTGLKSILLNRPAQLAKNMASQFVTYATGATPTFADRDELQSIVQATKPNHYGVRSLIHEVVQSPLFLSK